MKQAPKPQHEDWISRTKDFQGREIEDQAYNSPLRFILAGKEMGIFVEYDHDGTGSINLINHSGTDLMTSLHVSLKLLTVPWDSRGLKYKDSGWKMREIKAGGTLTDEYPTFPSLVTRQLKVTVSLHTIAIANERKTFSNLRTVMEDEVTSDFTIRCNTRTFRIHKAIFCARSPEFRAMILTDMEEAKKGEIFIKDIDEGTLSSMISYIYTGELELKEDFDVQTIAWTADKYNLGGWLELLCLKIREEQETKKETIANLLISAHMHNSKVMKETALEKIRNNREILQDVEFQEMIQEADVKIIFNLSQDLLKL